MINDYASLQAAVASWLARADLTAQIPDLIQMAELRIQDDIESPFQLVTVNATTSNGRYTLPDDFDDVISVSLLIGGESVPVQPLTINDGTRMDTAGLPVGYYITTEPDAPGPDAEQRLVLQLSGGADYSMTFIYRASIPTLSVSATTNWLLTARPNIYLYATLLEAAPFLQDDARIQVWATGYQTAIDAFNRKSEGSRYGVGASRRVDFHAP